MKKSLPMVRMCWGMMNELLNKANGLSGPSPVASRMNCQGGTSLQSVRFSERLLERP